MAKPPAQFQTSIWCRIAALSLSSSSLFACVHSGTQFDFDQPDWRLQFSEQRSMEHPDSLHYINQWTVKARVLVLQKGERERLSMKWSYSREKLGAPASQRIFFFDRLGRTALAIDADELGARLIDARQEYEEIQAEDLASLIEANTGILIPAVELPGWLMALNLAEAPSSAQAAVYPYGHWAVEYQAFDEFSGWLMPETIFIRSQDIELKITVTKWDLPTRRQRRAHASGVDRPMPN